MSLLGRRHKLDYEGVDWRARFELKFIHDRIILALNRKGKWVDSFYLNDRHWNELKERLGPKFLGTIYTMWGETDLVRTTERYPDHARLLREAP